MRFKSFVRTAALFGVVSSADAASITGIWQSYDDDTHEMRALIEIKPHGNTYDGRIIKLYLHPDEPQKPLCDACSGALKNAPILGLNILENVQEADGAFGGGTILDPESGTLYKVKIRPSEDGKSMQVKGYIGIELMGRSQTWTKAK